MTRYNSVSRLMHKIRVAEQKARYEEVLRCGKCGTTETERWYFAKGHLRRCDACRPKKRPR